MPALQLDKVESPSMRTSRKLKGLNKARATTLRRSSISLQLQAFVLQYGEGQRRQGLFGLVTLVTIVNFNN